MQALLGLPLLLLLLLQGGREGVRGGIEGETPRGPLSLRIGGPPLLFPFSLVWGICGGVYKAKEQSLPRNNNNPTLFLLLVRVLVSLLL